MNSLSAISALGAPDLQPLTDAAQKLVDKASIPPADLKTIGPAEGAPSEVGPLVAPSVPAGDSFGRLLGNLVGEVNSQQAAAGDAVRGLMSGQNVSLHQAMIAMQEANLSFQLMVEVRNKLLESYQELMRMQV